MKKSTAKLTLIYSLLLIALGIWGYIQGSPASLYAGSGLGVLLLFSSFSMLSGKKWGFYAALLLTAVVTAVFIYRSILTGKPIPITMAIVSVGMLFYLYGKKPKS